MDTNIATWFLGSVFSILLGSPLYLPWILVRIGKYKSWYLAYFAPPVIWGRAIYVWPLSAMFLSTPIVGLLPITPDERITVWGTIGLVGAILAGVMIIWTPDWAKPEWQRYLENEYSWREIRGVFIPYWRQMGRKTWNQLMESEEGIEELVRRARDSEWGDQSRGRD